MSLLRSIRLRLRALFQKRTLDAHMDDELRSHIEMQTQENIDAGMSPMEARYAALRQFGWVESIKDTCREQRGVSWIENLLKDVRFGARMLRKNPVFTTVAVLSLALGIGAATAIFSLVNAILLRSLPVPNPHELRLVNWSGADWESLMEETGTGVLNDDSGRLVGDSVSLSGFRALREQCAAQADIFGYSDSGSGTARARHEAFVPRGLMVSDNFFSGLGVRPLFGRLLGPDDERAGAPPAAVISYHCWEQQFDLDPTAVGQPVTLNGFNFTLVGVLPREFPGVRPGAGTDFYASLSAWPQLQLKSAQSLSERWWVRLMARLRPGVSDAQFQAALNVAFARQAETVKMKDPKVWMTAGRAGARGRFATNQPNDDRSEYGELLWLLLGVVGLVLLVACANLAGLMLARGAARQHEFAVRAALGASRGRLVRQSLTESVLVALLGGGLGLVIAIWGKTAIVQLMLPAQNGLHYDTSLNLRVLGFTLAISLVTALLSGLWPALRAANVDPLGGLKDRDTLGTPRLRAGRFLVTAQITLSLLLVGGAGLFVRTLVNLTQINTGYAMDHLLVFQVDLRNSGYGGREPRTAAVLDRVQESLAAIPGVRSVTRSGQTLLAGDGSGDIDFTLPADKPESRSKVRAHLSFVSETFFTTMGIPLVLGRDLRATDNAGAPPVVVVNEAFARKYLPGRNPIGLTIRDNKGWYNLTNLQIVGVCRDAKYGDIKENVQAMLHASIRQIATPGGNFILRTALPPLAVTRAARKAVAAIDPNVPLINISTLEQVRDAAIRRERTFAMLCGSLGALAVLLSCIGLYGLMAYQVARRTGEIGIRQALGATRRQIAGPILREALVLAGIGVVIGTPLTLALTRLIRSNLYGVGPADPVTFCGAAILFLAVALIAAWIPARRAARIDPMVALRSE